MIEKEWEIIRGTTSLNKRRNKRPCISCIYIYMVSGWLIILKLFADHNIHDDVVSEFHCGKQGVITITRIPRRSTSTYILTQTHARTYTRLALTML